MQFIQAKQCRTEVFWNFIFFAIPPVAGQLAVRKEWLCRAQMYTHLQGPWHIRKNEELARPCTAVRKLVYVCKSHLDVGSECLP